MTADAIAEPVAETPSDAETDALSDVAATPPPGDDGDDEESADTPIDVVLVEQAGLDALLDELPGPEAAWVRANGFRGRLGQQLALPAADGRVGRVLVGWGSPAARRRQRFALGKFAAAAPRGTYRLATELEPEAAEEAALGWLLARYRFDRYRSSARRAAAEPDPEAAESAESPPETEADDADDGDAGAHLMVPDGVDGQRLGLVAEGVFITRDLINTPANDMGPERLEAAGRKLAARHGAEVEVTTGDALLEANLPLIHTVGRAGAEAPRLIDLTWGEPEHPKVTLVGKGITFDTGGLNLKPGGAMSLMKKDMGGAATVLGLSHMIMSLGLPLRLRVLLAVAENAVSGQSMRPGDILTSRSGRTVEVNNTDAEGRLVLADALTLGAEEKPVLMADFATLTGAARVALGAEVAPFFTDDEALAAALSEGGARAADPVWRLPLWPGYEADIEPGIADLDNAPAGGMGGAITAALFLRRFTAGAGSWVHFDIYGWTPKPKPGRPKGGEAQAARALLDVLERRFGGDVELP
ncbi:MAG: leucyl aminopeptidase family protein [Pseudomonadota bacterium]